MLRLPDQSLGERLDAVTVGFALAVVAVVFVGRRMPADLGTTRDARR
jgi:hypothetical protein